MYNNDIRQRRLLLTMKNLAIILSLLMLAPSAFAGGTMLYVSDPAAEQAYQQQRVQYNQNANYYTKDGIYGAEQPQKASAKTTRKVRIGNRQKNDPNVYWNFGAVNFGSGFTSVGGGDKKY